jgi:hypothetical protein
MWVVYGPEWRAAAEALGSVDRQLPDWLADDMEQAVEPLMEVARQRVLREDVQGGPTRHTGMRTRIAEGLGKRAGLAGTRDAPYLRVYTSMPEQDESIIPRGMDSPKGWRHPLFGNRDHWQQSLPVRGGWFSDTFFPETQRTIERNMEDSLQRAADIVDAVS